MKKLSNPIRPRGEQGFAPATLMIIFVFLAVAGYLVIKSQIAVAPVQSPTPLSTASSSVLPDETAGWKTYTNTEWGFSISYPSTYQIDDNHFKKERPYYKNLVTIVPVPNTSFGPSLSISVVNDFGEYNPRYVTDLRDYVGTAYSSSRYEITPVNIGDNNGYQIDDVSDPSIQPRHIILRDQSGVIYDLFLPADSADLNMAVSTFRFTSPVAGPGESCGGLRMNPPVCMDGYHCVYDGKVIDGDGKCIKN